MNYFNTERGSEVESKAGLLNYARSDNQGGGRGG